MSYRQVHAFESISRQRRDLNHVAVLREGPFGYVPRAAGYRTIKINPPKAVLPPKNQCGSKFFVFDCIDVEFRLRATFKTLSSWTTW